MFCLTRLVEDTLLSQSVDLPTPHFVFMGRLDGISGQVVLQTISLAQSEAPNKSVTRPRLALDQNEPLRFGTEETGREKQWGFIVRTL
jgi:hypothetical protein